VMVDNDGDNWYLDDVKLEQNVSISNTTVSNINIYPNPSNGLVTITNAEGSSIEVINVTGQVVARFNANSNVTTFDAGFLRDGNYFVRIMDGSKITVKALNIIK
nr:T9SS type A sorting domain-containing protein [Bacteroidales bacterium]